MYLTRAFVYGFIQFKVIVGLPQLDSQVSVKFKLHKEMKINSTFISWARVSEFFCVYHVERKKFLSLDHFWFTWKHKKIGGQTTRDHAFSLDPWYFYLQSFSPIFFLFLLFQLIKLCMQNKPNLDVICSMKHFFTPTAKIIYPTFVTL